MLRYKCSDTFSEDDMDNYTFKTDDYTDASNITVEDAFKQ